MNENQTIDFQQYLSINCVDISFLTLYMQLIRDAQALNRIKLPKNHPNYVYLESHHILPRCLYPQYAKESQNLVLLTAREHFVAHYYLIHMFNSKDLDYAYWRMCTDKRGRQITADEYELGKQRAALRSSELNKGKCMTPETKQKLSDSLKGRKHSEETKKKIGEKHKGQHLSEQQKRHLSEIKTGLPGTPWTEQQKQKLRDQRMGEGNPMYNKINKNFMTDEAYAEYKTHLSQSLKGHPVSEETKEKIRKKAKDRQNFAGGNNPKAKNIQCLEDDLTFPTLAACGAHYGLSKDQMTQIAKTGFSKKLNKHFVIIN